MSAADAIARFRAELGSAVTRASRAAGEAGARNSALRSRSQALAEEAKARRVSPGSHDPTPADLRDAATGFRTDRGLPVEQLPGAAELLTPPPPVEPAPERKTATLGSTAVAGPSGQLPRLSEDDEDFSQSRILY